MVINIISVEKQYARLFARDIEKSLQGQGQIVSFVTKEGKNREAFKAAIDNIVQYGKAILILDNYDNSIQIQDEPLLADINIILLNEKDASQLKEAAEITERIQSTYASHSKEANVATFNVYNRVGIPKQSADTTTRISGRIRTVKQTP